VTDDSPLYGLRLATPRLELRLGSRAELEALAEVARAGIHPPDEMPFAVPWTDASDDPDFVTGFVEHHEQALEAWTPTAWSLNLLVFHDGARSGRRRSVPSGSRSTGRSTPGRGSAQRARVAGSARAAVLELAFGRLGAATARSGWLEGGAGQSARVSARLGYREVGTHLEQPRGEPVAHHDLVLEADRWSCPFPVGIEGVEPCLGLFGARTG
jgi:hypothetical protein